MHRRFIKVICCVVILSGPPIVGAFPSGWLWSYWVGSLAVVLCAFGFRSPRATAIISVVVSVGLAIASTDLALRLFPGLVNVPTGLVEKWPRLPLVIRYVPDLNYSGYRFNDLSRMANVKQWREDKLVTVITDSAGFRNEGLDPSRPLDVILLGDSFGAGAVSHENTWTSMLARDYQLAAYNLSSPASGPWQQYVNLGAEQDRLKTGPDAVLIWQLFTGNDLDESYGSLEMKELPWCGPAKTWFNRLGAMRERSPVRYLLERFDHSQAVVDRDFLNGRKLLFYKPYIESTSRSREEIVKHPNYLPLRATVAAVKGLAESRGLRAEIVLVPAKEEVYAWSWKDAPPWTTEPVASEFATVLAESCAEAGLGFLDLKPHLVRESRRIYEESGELLYWYDDTHMNVVGNKVCTQLIYRELARGRNKEAAGVGDQRLLR